MAKYHFPINVRKAMAYMRRNEVGELHYEGQKPKVTTKNGTQYPLEGVEFHPIIDSETLYVRINGELVTIDRLDEDSQNKVARDVLNTKF